MFQLFSTLTSSQNSSGNLHTIVYHWSKLLCLNWDKIQSLFSELHGVEISEATERCPKPIPQMILSSNCARSSFNWNTWKHFFFLHGKLGNLLLSIMTLNQVRLWNLQSSTVRWKGFILPETFPGSLSHCPVFLGCTSVNPIWNKIAILDTALPSSRSGFCLIFNKMWSGIVKSG